MSYREIVKKNNPIIYQLIKNAILGKKMAHAFLFSAPYGVNIETEPKFLIQSLISENPFLSKELRAIKSYADLQIIDGSDKLIKKDFVTNALSSLQSTALESNAKKILWIKNIENSNKQSLNSLLKFMEEPTNDTYIIMSTNNLSNVLDTIKSRSQIIQLKTPSVDYLIDEFKNNGYEEKNARVLAHIYTSTGEPGIPTNDEVNEYYASCVSIMEESIENSTKIFTRSVPFLSKNNYKISLGLLRVFINDIWKHHEGLPIVFTGKEDLLKRYYGNNFNFTKALEIINDFFKMQDYHVNFDLYKSQLLVRIGDCYE